MRQYPRSTANHQGSIFKTPTAWLPIGRSPMHFVCSHSLIRRWLLRQVCTLDGVRISANNNSSPEIMLTLSHTALPSSMITTACLDYRRAMHSYFAPGPSYSPTASLRRSWGLPFHDTACCVINSRQHCLLFVNHHSSPVIFWLTSLL